MKTILLLDTNVLLHAKSIHSINWTEAAQANDIVLAIAPIVLEELERHKTGLAAEGLRNRAMDSIRLLHKALRADPNSDAPLSSHQAKLRLLQNRRVAANGDARFSDDQLLGSLDELRDSNPNDRVAIVTRDECLQLRCWQRGHEVLVLPPNEWRTSGPTIRKGPDAQVSILVDGRTPDADKPFEKEIVAAPSDDEIETRLEAQQQNRLQTLEKEDPGWLRRNPAGVAAALAREHREATEFLKRDAETQRRGSLLLAVQIEVVNSGAVRLDEIAIDPFTAEIKEHALATELTDTRIGQIGGANGPGFGINPRQAAMFRYAVTLTDTSHNGLMRVHLKYTLTTDKLSLDDDVEFDLALREKRPLLRVSPIG